METKNKRRYFDLTESEKLALNDNEFVDSVKIESIHRGIKPPVDLAEALSAVAFTGFTIPADAVKFYEITTPGEYSHSEPKPTGLAFTTEEAALNACKGAVCIGETGYGAGRTTKIFDGEPSVACRFISLRKPANFSTKLEEVNKSTEEFDKLCEECRDDLSAIRQARYDKKVRSQKRLEYLRLAEGNEQVASAFWSKTETGDWPAE